MQPSPISSRLPLISLGLALGGIAVSAYLTLVHFRDDLLVCAVGDLLGTLEELGDCPLCHNAGPAEGDACPVCGRTATTAQPE